MLAVMFFSLVFGGALSVVGPRGETLVRALEGLFDVSMAIIGFAMRLAPVGVACLVFAVTARLGIDILSTLLWFLLTVLLGMGLHLFVVYPLFLMLVPGVGRRVLSRYCRSHAHGLRHVEFECHAAGGFARGARHFKLPREISQFVLTIGSTGNQNGTALYEGVVVLFLAQVFGVHLTLGQQLGVVLMSVLAGVGTAGVPGGSLPLIVLVLRSVDVPGEGIAIILGIDRISGHVPHRAERGRRSRPGHLRRPWREGAFPSATQPTPAGPGIDVAASAPAAPHAGMSVRDGWADRFGAVGGG